ncbi:hypothetical protein [Novosphingobium sp.]|uniref:hypothetical protein n=1 Tax=Novosphingobium sp. TaxID=1874826 RepID=UPI0031D09AA3
MMGDDLNDYAYFVQVLAQGGFVITRLALREPKSKLSHRPRTKRLSNISIYLPKSRHSFHLVD